MVDKVTLDMLEPGDPEIPLSEIEEPEIPLPEQTPPTEEESGGEKSGRWQTSKWLRIAVIALVMLIAAGGLFYWSMGAKKTTHRLPEKKGAPTPTATSLPKAPLTSQVNDFIVTLQDDKGKYFVMTCDLTFELGAGKDVIFQQNIVEIRKTIYEILKKTRVASPLAPRIRIGLKTEITKAVSDLVGQDAIRAIYFTKFVVL